MDNTYNIKKMLMKLESDDTITFEDGLLDKLNAMTTIISKRTKVKRLGHKYVFNEREGRFRTKIAREGLPAKTVAKKSEEDLLDAILDFYGPQKYDDFSFEDFYPVWEAYIAPDVASGTLRDYEIIYNRFYKRSFLAKMKLKDIKSSDLKRFFNDQAQKCIEEKRPLNMKGVNNLFSIARGMMDYALVECIIDENPFIRLDMRRIKRSPLVSRHEHLAAPNERTFSPEEEETLTQVLEDNLKNRPTELNSLAILFLFQTGLRSGELATLRWSDISEDEMYIHSTEQRVFKRGDDGKQHPAGYQVKESTKTGLNRNVPLNDEARNLLNRVRNAQDLLGINNPEFVFEKKAGRSYAAAFRDALYKRCQKAHIQNLSCHDIRRTVSAKLESQKMSPKMIASVLGHTEETNKNYYQDDIVSMDEKAALMQNL